MCDGHFARIFANFKDIQEDLLVFHDFFFFFFGEGGGGGGGREVKIPGVFQDSWNSRSL